MGGGNSHSGGGEGGGGGGQTINARNGETIVLKGQQ